MHDTPAYEAETDGIVVRVRPSFLAGQSNPDAGRWVWAYQVEIVNLTGSPLQLMSRHWIITDAEDKVQEVRGEGVIGQQPELRPGESFEYTSGCSLATPVGTMKGSYFMEAADGRQFDAPIAEFTLAMPRTLH